VHRCSKVIAQIGQCQVGKITAGEKGKMVTHMCDECNENYEILHLFHTYISKGKHNRSFVIWCITSNAGSCI